MRLENTVTIRERDCLYIRCVADGTIVQQICWLQRTDVKFTPANVIQVGRRAKVTKPTLHRPHGCNWCDKRPGIQHQSPPPDVGLGICGPCMSYQSRITELGVIAGGLPVDDACNLGAVDENAARKGVAVSELVLCIRREAAEQFPNVLSWSADFKKMPRQWSRYSVMLEDVRRGFRGKGVNRLL